MTIKSFRAFREYLSGVEAKSHERFVFYHFDPADRVAEVVIRLLLNEEKPSVELGKGRSILFHKAHVLNTQDHLHFQVKGAKIAAVNKDGTAHDQSHGFKLQKWAMEGAAKHYPDFKIPKDRIIEQLMAEPGNQVLNEGFVGGDINIPLAIQTLALVKAAGN
jgi:hypothetical protein